MVLEGVLSPERVTKSEPVFNWGENNFDINVPLTVDNISGSNIFNNTGEQGGLEQGNYSSSTGEPIDGYTYYRNSELVEVEPNAKYVIAVNGVATPFVILHYDENQNFISESRGNSVFVVPNNCKYINFRCYQHYYDEDWGFLKITISKADPIALPSGSILADLTYPVGSIYTSNYSDNPANTIGGTWELIKTYTGGELIAYATVWARDGNTIASGTDTEFSSSNVGSKDYEMYNYVSDILNYSAGTILVNPQNIVGMVEAFVSLSGLGGSGLRGIWWHDNNNALPTGVSRMGGTQHLATGPIDANYGGNSNTYIFKVEGNESFYVNPLFSPYNGTFRPSISGTLSWLQVKAYAKAGESYVWKRIA